MVSLPSFIASPAGWIKRFAVNHPVWTGVIVIGGGLIFLLLRSLFSPAQPQYITSLVKRGDLVQKVEAVGTVTSDQALNLKFPTTGIIAAIAVKEGDTVKAGQELVSLRNDSARADLGAAAAQYAQASANLQELEQGTRPEDLAIAEADVESKRASLQAAKADLQSAEEKMALSEKKLEAYRLQLDANLANNLQTAGSTAQQQVQLATTALAAVHTIATDPIVIYLGEQYASTSYGVFRQKYMAAQTGIDAAAVTVGSPFTTYDQAIATLRSARSAVVDASLAIQQLYDLVATLPFTQGFDSTVRDSDKTTIATQKSNVQSALATIDTTIKSLQDAATGFDTNITSEETTYASAKAAKQTAESSVRTYEALLAAQEAQLALKVAGPRETTIAASRAAANAAAANVTRARARLDDTIIRAPADGIITKVDFKLGEFTGDPANASHSVTMLGSSPFRIEMFLSEVDIPKVALTQTGSIELDAFPGVHYALRVTSIEPGPTTVDGVAKYRVILNFVHPHSEFKISMSGDGEIITGERKDVLLAPVRAIIQGTDGTKIVRVLQGQTVVEKTVTTGMESDTDAEIVSGLTEGDTVIVLIKK